MAVTPKTGRSKMLSKAGASTLSASEALKAAEAAIAPPASSKPVAARQAASKPAPVKPVVAQPKAAPTASDPVAIIAATTAIDSAPEPDVLPEIAAAPVVEKAAPEPKIQKTVQTAEGTKTMNDMMETGKKFAEDAKAKLETAYAGLNEKAKSSVEKSTKAIEEMSDMAKGNVEAMMESGKIAAKAMETLSQEAVEYGRKSMEKATASLKTFATVKTPTEFFQLQSQMMSSSFDDFAKEAAKSSEAMMKMASEVASPLTARVTLVTDKVKSLAA